MYFRRRRSSSVFGTAELSGSEAVWGREREAKMSSSLPMRRVKVEGGNREAAARGSSNCRCGFSSFWFELKVSVLRCSVLA